MINLYQSDVAALPDEQLEALSLELQEEYERNGEEESYWTDDDAEQRYYSLQAEIRIRWDAANPEEAAKRRDFFKSGLGSYARLALESIAKSVEATFATSRQFDGEFRKVGDTIQIRKPERFIAYTGADCPLDPPCAACAGRTPVAL